MAARHLVTDLKFALLGDVNFDLLDYALLDIVARFDAGDLPLLVRLKLVELALEGVDDLHDLDPDRRRIDFDVFGNSGQFAQQRLGDFPVGRNDHFVVLTVDHVERNLFPEENVRKRFRETFAQLVHLRPVFLVDLLHLTAAIRRTQFLLLGIETVRNLHVHDDSGNARRNHQRSILHVGRLLPEDRPQKFLFRCQLGLALRRDLTDKNIARFHFGSDADNAVVVQVLQRFFPDIRNIARDLFWSELGVPSGDFELLNVDRSEDIFLLHLLADQNRVFEVVTIPRHEPDEHVATKSEFALVRASAVRHRLARLYLLPLLHERLLGKAGSGVGTHELPQLVNLNPVLRIALRIPLETSRQLPVAGNHDAPRIDRSDHAIFHRDHHRFRVASHPAFDSGSHQRSFRLQQRHTLALHVRAHQRAVRVVMLKERNQTSRNRNQLFRRNVHVVDLARINFQKLTPAANGHFADEFPVVIDFRIRLSQHHRLFLVGGQIVNFIRHPAIFTNPVRTFDKAEFVDPRVNAQRVDQTDVRTFRRFNRTNPAIVRRMNVANLESSPLPVQTARPQRAQTAFVRDLRQRIDLVHELRKLAAREEIANHRAQRLRIDQLLRRDRIRALIVKGHPFANQSLRPRQPHPALISQKLAHRPHAPASQVVNIVDESVALLQPDQILRGLNDVLRADRPLIQIDLQTELLIDLVTPDPSEVITLRIEEQPFQQRLRVRRGRRFARSQAFVNFLKRFFLVPGRILLQRPNDRTFVDGRVDHPKSRNPALLELTDNRLRQRLKRAGDHDALLRVDRVFHQHEVTDVVELQRLGHAQLLDLVKQIQDIDIGTVSDRPQKCRDQKLPATAAAVEINVKQIVVVELHFQPSPAIGNHPVGIKHFPGRMRRHFKGDPRRTVKLAHDHALRSIDNERTALRDHRDFSHVDLLVLDEILLAQTKLHIKGNGIGNPFPDALDLVVLRTDDIVGEILQDAATVVTLDRENFAKHRLKAARLPLGRRDILLQELQVRIQLVLDQIRRSDHFLQFTKIDAVRHT